MCYKKVQKLLCSQRTSTLCRDCTANTSSCFQLNLRLFLVLRIRKRRRINWTEIKVNLCWKTGIQGLMIICDCACTNVPRKLRYVSFFKRLRKKKSEDTLISSPVVITKLQVYIWITQVCSSRLSISHLDAIFERVTNATNFPRRIALDRAVTRRKATRLDSLSYLISGVPLSRRLP